MLEISSNDLSNVSGGNPAMIAEAVVLGGGIFMAPYGIGQALGYDWNYVSVGSDIGAWAFEVTHPDPLGQMIYTATDFGGSYIVPTPFND